MVILSTTTKVFISWLPSTTERFNRTPSPFEVDDAVTSKPQYDAFKSVNEVGLITLLSLQRIAEVFFVVTSNHTTRGF